MEAQTLAFLSFLAQIEADKQSSKLGRGCERLSVLPSAERHYYILLQVLLAGCMQHETEPSFIFPALALIQNVSVQALKLSSFFFSFFFSTMRRC